MNYGFIIDNRKCIGCHACTVACKAEHDVPIGVNRTWVKYIEKGQFPHTRRVFSVMRCNHCEDAPCVEICPVQALYIREDGIVDFDNRRCIGCKACTQACPYDSIYIDPQTHTAAKCNYCAHRIDIGLEPACVNVCPEHAIISGDLDDPNSEISQLLGRYQVTARKVEKGTRPKLFYIDGDEASLKPVVTQQLTEYMWSAQATGVGHYARYAEARLQQADPEKLQRQLNGNGQQWLEADGERVMVPGVGDGDKFFEKAKAVLKENARRVYDAPRKGVMWGWEVSAYVWTKAISAGAFLVLFGALGLNLASVPGAFQWAAAGLGLIFLALTGLLLIKDLDKPTRFAYVLLRPQWNSWLVRGGYLITLYGGLVTFWGIGKFFQISALQQVTLWLGALAAVMVAIYTAFLFAQAKGRDFWQNPVLPLHMFGHSVLAGAAALALFMPFLGTTADWSLYLSRVMIAALIFNALVLIVELVTHHPTEDARLTVDLIVRGPFRWAFWLGAIGIGLILPLLILILGSGSVLEVSAAGLLALVGMYFTEHIWVRAPQLIPLS
ncbi:MAG: polysulfide reductase NrfD [Calditrichaeota bacterium]|nr:polysulfide reductase NrfD [Calditrichota bacterium]